MTPEATKKPPLWTRLLPAFLLWTALRAAYSVTLGRADPDYRIAAEAGVGNVVWIAQAVYAFLATGAAVAMWRRSAHVTPISIAALAMFTSLTVAQLLQVERDPLRARRAYAASREARGLPVSDERLDAIFSPAGRTLTWAIGLAFCLGPLGLFLWRRRHFEAPADAAAVVLGIEALNARLAEERRVQEGGYGPSPLPRGEYDPSRGEHQLLDPQRIPLDDTLAAACRGLFDDPSVDLDAVRRAIDMDQLYTLITFSRRTAVFAIREGRAERIREALAALALLERDRVDYRDIAWALAIVRHAAIRIGADVIALFFAAAARAEGGTAELIKASAAESATVNTLRDAWGYADVSTARGAGLIQWQFCAYDPTIDLAALIIDLAALLDRDRYAADDPAIAADLPGVWLGEDRRPADVAAALEPIRAVASVSGHDRSQREWHRAQRLVLFVAELPSPDDVRPLVELSRTRLPSAAPGVDVSFGTLFCLVIALSPSIEVHTDETPATLHRFVPDIASALRRHVR